ncbi:MAG: hypothetical protein ACPG42_05680 [Alphaproteobacteria bacterium]
MASIQINRRKLLGTGGASLALLGTGLLASRPAFSQSAAYYMPDAVRDWSDAPRLTFGETAAVSDFEALAEVPSFHAPGDTRTPYTLLGRVFDREKKLVDFAHLNFWQTNADGTYVGDGYRGHVSADRLGRFSLSTVMPTAYLDGDGILRAPHLHVAVFAPRVARQVFQTEMFFPGDESAKLLDRSFVAANEIEFEVQADQSLLGYFNIFLG